MTTPTNSTASVKVVVRLRPMNEKEKKEGTLPVISCSTTNQTITVIKGTGSNQKRTSYHFDNVFGSFSTQEEVFDATLKPVIEDVMQGYEMCVFAYGQTGTGKTHTMEGSLESVDQYGVIPRSAQAIFDRLEGSTFNVSCSYLEIYNEELSDLLVDNPLEKQKLDVLSSVAVKVRGLSSTSVSSTVEVLNCMAKAAQNRKVGETNMNKLSSRSHCIFTINVERTSVLSNGDVIESKGKLHLVDLAGSESAKTAYMRSTSAEDQATRDQERRNINQSLLALGRVIAGLTEKRGIVPYRDSKLTRILQEALGGRCKTVIIATVSPSIMNLNESVQTLQYATKAQGIQNKPIATSYMTMNSPRRGPMGSSSENMIPAERWEEMEIRMQHMQHEVEEARAALARKYVVEQELVGRAEVAEEERDDLREKLTEATEKIEVLTEDLQREREAKRLVEDELASTQAELETRTEELREEREARRLVEEELASTKAELAERTEELRAEREAKRLVEDELASTQAELAKRTEELRVEREAKQLVLQKLKKTTMELENTRLVLKATQETEVALTKEAEALLDVLRRSIADGDDLHATIVTKREQEVERRKATTQFHDALLLGLDEVMKTLHSLDESESSHCAKTTQSLLLDRDEQLNRMTESKSVTSSLVQKVIRLSDGLKAMTQGEIRAQLESLQSSVTSDLTAAQSTLANGETKLSENCEVLRCQLRDYSANFAERKVAHGQSLTEALEIIESKLVEVQQKMKAFVDDSTAKLQAVGKDSAETREALVKDLGDWSASCIETATASKNLSSTQKQVLDDNRQMLSTEMKRYATVGETLSEQQELLGRSRASQQGTLSDQMGVLHEHEEEIKKAQKSQEALCHSVMRNVMSGVESLVNEQVKQILAQHEVSTERLLKQNTESMSLNDEMKTSVETFMADVGHVNEKIGNEANKLEEADTTICSVMHEAATAFVEIGNTSTKQLQTRDHFVELTNVRVSTLQSLESRSAYIEGRLQSNGDECREHVTKITSTSIKESVSKTAEAGSDAIDHVLDSTIPDALVGIDKLEEPRGQTLQDITDQLQNAEAIISRDIGTLKSAGKRQLELAGCAVKECVETEGTYVSAVDKYEVQCKENSKFMADSIKSHEDSMVELSKQCKGIVTESSQNTSAFGNGVIHMNTEVEPVTPRIVWEYSSNLSATPSRESILKNCENGQGPTSTCTANPKHIDKGSPADELTSPCILRESLSMNAEGHSRPPRPNVPKKERVARTSLLKKPVRARER